MLPDFSVRKILFLIVRILSELYNNLYRRICSKLFPGRISVEWIIMRHRSAYFDFAKPEHFASVCYSLTDLKTIFPLNTTVEI